MLLNFSFLLYFHCCGVGFVVVKVAANVLQLGEVAEIEVQMFSFAQKFNRRTAVEFCTEPAILPNCCYLLCFSSVVINYI
jgi:hypothetical protein